MGDEGGFRVWVSDKGSHEYFEDRTFKNNSFPLQYRTNRTKHLVMIFGVSPKVD